jgi:hypothetical protein
MEIEVVEARNHLGWEVQEFDPTQPERGWVSAVEEVHTDDNEIVYFKPVIFPIKDSAKAWKQILEEDPSIRKRLEFRVYEVLKEKSE